jgi:hypothetical protein
VLTPLKAHLHNGKNCSKLLRFKEQKKKFAFLKHCNLSAIKLHDGVLHKAVFTLWQKLLKAKVF